MRLAMQPRYKRMYSQAVAAVHAQQHANTDSSHVAHGGTSTQSPAAAAADAAVYRGETFRVPVQALRGKARALRG